ALHKDNLTTWLESEAVKLGTKNQRERWADKLLPEDELKALARHELFKLFALDHKDIKRWIKIRSCDLPHEDACQASESQVDYSTPPPTGLDHDSYERLKAIRAIADAASKHEWLVRSEAVMQVETRLHRGQCQVCKAWFSAPTALVKVMWAGRPLSREYEL